MHEMAITQGVVDTVRERIGEATVTVVRLEIGRLSGVVADSVRFCFEVVADGTPLSGARLDIDEPAGRARCNDCGCDFTLDDLILLCPCGSADVRVLGGRELRIMSVEVA